MFKDACFFVRTQIFFNGERYGDSTRQEDVRVSQRQVIQRRVLRCWTLCYRKVAAIRHISHSCLDPNDFTVLNCIVKGHASLSPPSLRFHLCSRFTLLATYIYFDPKDFSLHPIDSVKGHASLSPLAQQKAKKKNKAKKNIDSKMKSFRKLCEVNKHLFVKFHVDEVAEIRIQVVEELLQKYDDTASGQNNPARAPTADNSTRLTE
ncbi:hypothetical protein TNCV_3726871 [Trichonephila clavipes]|nr:hypothetical protein TNCV_3726871 [Trichonephila clavipes]